MLPIDVVKRICCLRKIAFVSAWHCRSTLSSLKLEIAERFVKKQQAEISNHRPRLVLQFLAIPRDGLLKLIDKAEKFSMADAAFALESLLKKN